MSVLDGLSVSVLHLPLVATDANQLIGPAGYGQVWPKGNQPGFRAKAKEADT